MSDITESRYRYVTRIVDGKPVYLLMQSCNYCPFFISDSDKDEALCSRYVDPKSNRQRNNHIDDIYGYIYRGSHPNFKKEVLGEVKIPSWCKLPKSLSKAAIWKNVYHIKDGKLIIENKEKYGKGAIEVIDYKNVRYEPDCETVVLTNRKKKKQKDYRYASEYSSSSYKVCSCCGKEKDDVDRSTHNGMCGECYEKYKDDDGKMYMSYINNFRLKRKESFSKLEYDKIKGVKPTIR